MSFNSQDSDETYWQIIDAEDDAEDDATRFLSQNSHSFRTNLCGVARVDLAQWSSNSPCEDRFNRIQPLPLGKEMWFACAMFDGHNGWQMAEFLEQRLLARVHSRLSEVEPQFREGRTPYVLREVFVELDESVMNTYADSAYSQNMKLADKMRHAQVALSGSCALLILYNPSTRALYTACTSDSRAILGQPNSDNIWKPIPLSDDQKAGNKSEVGRIQREHPGGNPVREGKLLGMSAYRAFGDSAWKLPHEVQYDLDQRLGTQASRGRDTIRTPPYLTAGPVVCMRNLEPEQPCFMVLATQGVWNECSSQDVVDLVVRWLKAQPEPAHPTILNTSIAPFPKPIENPPGWDLRQRRYGFDMRFGPERTVVQDLDNVAVHLLRNACGGSHDELLTMRLAAQPPHSRGLRDDMTVQVIFFQHVHMKWMER